MATPQRLFRPSDFNKICIHELHFYNNKNHRKIKYVVVQGHLQQIFKYYHNNNKLINLQT